MQRLVNLHNYHKWLDDNLQCDLVLRTEPLYCRNAFSSLNSSLSIDRIGIQVNRAIHPMMTRVAHAEEVSATRATGFTAIKFEIPELGACVMIHFLMNGGLSVCSA
jgi:hypothetical protein